MMSRHTLHGLLGPCLLSVVAPLLAVAQGQDPGDADTSAAEAAIAHARRASGSMESQISAPSDQINNAAGDLKHPHTDRGAREFPEAQRFMRSVRIAWRSLKTANEFKEPIDKTLDSLDEAYTAYDGVVPTTDPDVDRLREFSQHLRARLWALKGKSTNAWLMDSGVNVFQPSTIVAAQTYLDSWSHELASLESAIGNFLPLVKAQRFITGSRATSKTALGTAMTDEGLNEVVFENDIIPPLEASINAIPEIQGHLDAARNTLTAPSMVAHGNESPDRLLDTRPCVASPGCTCGGPFMRNRTCAPALSPSECPMGAHACK